MYLPGRKLVVVTSYRLVAEACDEKRFKKDISAPLREVRNGVHDGLFTAHDTEWNWGLAHRVLTPPFGPLSIEGMFDEMHDVATQLVMVGGLFSTVNHGHGILTRISGNRNGHAMDQTLLSW